MSSDDRRDIRAITVGHEEMQDFTIKAASKPLGNHYHRRKHEIFYFLVGGGVVQLAQVNSEGKIAGPIDRISVEPGSVVRIPPFTAHRFDLQPLTRFVAYASAPFDQNDMLSCLLPDPN